MFQHFQASLHSGVFNTFALGAGYNFEAIQVYIDIL